MTVEVLPDGSERFVTKGGIVIRRSRHDVEYASAIDACIDALDSRLGAVFSSNYEYPGRYTRWDTAIVDPPLVISARGRDMRIEALNERGQVLLGPILHAVEGVADAVVGRHDEDCIELRINEPGRPFTEEERTRMPSVFSILRAVTALFRSDEDA